MTTQSGESSPGGSNSLSNSSVRTTRTSEDDDGQVAPHKSFHLDSYNSSPERDDESDGQCCDEEALSQLALHSELFRRVTSIGIQTEYNDDFPPLKFLRALGEDPTGFVPQQQAFYFAAGGGSDTGVPTPLLLQQQQQPSQQQNQQHPPSQMPMPTLSAAVTNVVQTKNAAANAINAAAVTANATAMDASSSSSDGTLQLVIQNFRHMSDTVRGPCKYIQTVPWRIMVMPRQHVVQKKGTQKCLGFFLQCCPDAYSESWSCQASAELRLISQKAGIPNFIRKTNHVYTAKENDWGYSCFMTWADILDESQGYIKDDKVTLEVQVKADPPKNILTHNEFKKKIQDYKRLADLQCQRGLIDKAIECNTQALKFCKDKDPQCKTELEAQKAHLIEMKLKQSIQRIEKGSDGSKIDDDSATNLNALRQALGTTTRCNASKATKNKSTSTKDTNATMTTQNSNTHAVEKQQQPRVSTPPYTTTTQQQKLVADAESKLQALKKQNKTSKSVEPHDKKGAGLSAVIGAAKEGQNLNCSAGNVKKRLYKSASTNELSGINANCKEDFDFVNDRYQEEEELLPDQIKHFLKHLSEGDKDASRLKEQIAKLELIASPFEKPDPFLLEGIMKLSPEEADKALVKAITFYALERENERERGRLNDPNQLKRFDKVIRNKFCESCIHEGHIQIGKRETSEFGCQTEFTRRVPREAIATDDATLRMMQQLEQQQQQLLGHHAINEEYINSLKNQAFAAVQHQHQQHQNVQNQIVVNVPTRRKKAAAKKSLQQQQQQISQPLQEFQQQQQNLLQQQHQQFQQQFIQVANARSAQQAAADGGVRPAATMAITETMTIDLNNPHMELFAAATKPLPGLDMNLAALTNLDLSKIHFPTDPTMAESSATTASMANNPPGNTIFSRQYIEEWLRYSTRNLLKTNYDGDKQQQQATMAAASSASATSTSGDNPGCASSNQIYSVDPQDVTATQAALFQLHCLNAKNIQNKVEEFVQTLESHANFCDLRNCIDRLLTLCADDENFTSAEDTVSVISVSECSGREFDATKDGIQDYSTLQRSFIEDDPHDYILFRELKQQELMLSTRLNAIVYQLHQASISDIVDRIEAKMKVLDDKLKLSKNERSALISNDKKTADQLTLVQKEFQNLNGKYEKLIQQLKDRKNEIKKLEKKAKSEAFMQERLDELQERLDAAKKELSATQRQLSEEQSKYKRDTQSLADSKKHLNVELNSKYSEVQKLSTQLDEKSQALKKLESQLANERKTSSQTASNLTERAKRAEVNFLEHKLDDGLRILERAKDDCNAQIKILETEKQKRTLTAEIDVIKWNISEWESKREEVTSLISQAKTDFGAHIQSIKSGKQLMQLPKLQVPKPPPCPRIHPLPASVAQQPTSQSSNTNQSANQQQQQVPPSPLSLDRKVITPPGKARAVGSTTPHQNSTTQSKQQQALAPVSSSSSSSATAVSTPVKSNAAAASGSIGHFQSSVSLASASQSQQSPMQPPPHIPPPIAPIGVRPLNYQNGITVPPPLTPAAQSAAAQHKFATAVAQQIGQQPPPQRHSPQMGHSNQFVAPQPMQQQQHQHFHSTSSSHSSTNAAGVGGQHASSNASQQSMPQQTLSSTSLRQPPPPLQQQQQQPQTPQGNVARPSPSFQRWSGGWGDQLNHMNNISDIFGQGRSFGPLGSDFGGGVGGGVLRSASVTSHQQQPIGATPGTPVGVICAPGNVNNTPSSQPIGAGRNIQNVSPSQTQLQQQQRNGWSTFTADTWNPSSITRRPN